MLAWQPGTSSEAEEHAPSTKPPSFPPGAATLIAERPKFVKGEGSSMPNHGPAKKSPAVDGPKVEVSLDVDVLLVDARIEYRQRHVGRPRPAGQPHGRRFDLRQVPLKRKEERRGRSGGTGWRGGLSASDHRIGQCEHRLRASVDIVPTGVATTSSAAAPLSGALLPASVLRLRFPPSEL